jgi:hypothetical protein
MAFTYQEFTSTPATIIADLKTKIVLSSNWTVPTGNVVQCTAANGATMALDLTGGGAADNQRIRTMAYRLFSGGVGTNGVQRSLYWNRVAPASSATLRVRVFAGNTLLYIEIEGPRAGEAGADSTTFGSYRQSIWLAQITPYHGADTIPCVAFGGTSSYHGYESIVGTAPNSQVVYVSRNQGDTSSWVTARIMTLTVPAWQINAQAYNYRALASDGTQFLLPWVVFEDSAGIRGRLTDMFYAGWSASDDTAVVGTIADSQTITYGGNTYRVTTPWRTDQTGSANSFGSFGVVANASVSVRSPLVACRVI